MGGSFVGSRVAVLLLLTLPVFAGCASYAPLPIDEAAHRESWLARSPADASVAALARRLAAAGNERAATFDPSDGLTLAEAEIVALAFHPELRLLRVQAQVPYLESLEAGRWPDPQFDADVRAILAEVDQPLEVGAGLVLTIPLTGRLGVERSLRLAEFDAQRWEVRLREVALLAELRALWARFSALLQQRDLLVQHEEALRAVLLVVEGLVAAGEVHATQQRSLELDLLARAGERAELTDLARLAELAIRERLGLAPGTTVELIPAARFALPLPAAETWHAALHAQHPLLHLRRAAHEAAERGVELEVLRQVPDLSLGIGWSYEDGNSRLGLGFGLPIPLLDGNRRAIARARGERFATLAQFEATVESLEHALAWATAEREAAARRLAFLVEELAPAVDAQLDELRELAALGEYDATLLLDVLQRRHEVLLRITETTERLALAENAVFTLIGGGYTPLAQDESTQDEEGTE